MKTSKDTTIFQGRTEPNWAVFKHRGLDCLILRHMTMGHLCGYVRLPINSPEYKALANRRKLHTPDYFRKGGRVRRAYGPDFPFSVHGGITFGGPHHFYRARRGLWVGFDCLHYMDIAPFAPYSFNNEGTYRDIAFVERECRALADQIVGVSTITE